MACFYYMNDAMTWDLSDLYAGVDDPKIHSDINSLNSKIQEFDGEYRGKIVESSSAQFVRQCLEMYSEIMNGMRKLDVFASLEHSTHTDVEEYGVFFQRISTATTHMQTALVFVETQLITLSDTKLKELVDEEILEPFRHYLRLRGDKKPHYLSEDAERIMQQKSLTGNQAFIRLHEQKSVSQKVAFALPGEEEKLVSEDYVLHLLRDSRREVRKSAMIAVGEIAQKSAGDTTFIYNTLIQDYTIHASLRGFASGQDMRHMENELQRPVVETLVGVVTDSYSLVQDYYKFKREVMGVDELFDYDKYAPVSDDAKMYSFAEARDMIQTAMQEFSPKFAEVSALFFDNNWIDAGLSPHKRGGAFCAYGTPDIHPYVFMNYHGSMRDVFVLAHELGHGLQGYMARHQNVLQYDWPLPIAETASIFSEMFLFKSLMAREVDPARKLHMYMAKIEEMFATVFRQISMYQFELRAHEMRHRDGELSKNQLNIIWQEVQYEMFGDSLQLTKGQEAFWGLVPHFFHTPFYVYSYAFGQLLTLSLFSIYEKHPTGFVEKYAEFFAQSGAKSPEDLLNIFGVDMHDASFWKQGIDEIKTLFESAQKEYKLVL